MMSHDSYVDLIGHLDDLVAIFEEHPDERTREQVTALLGGLDALHREGLSRLVVALHEAGGGVLLEQAARDPVVKILLGLYDLAELDLPEQQQVPEPSGFVMLDDVRVLSDEDIV